MSDELLGVFRSLQAVMEEETALLERGDRPAEVAPLAAAKLKLVGELEHLVAEQERVAPDWLGDAEPEIGETVSRLRDAAAANAAILARQIDLSKDLLQEIAREAQRLGGTRQQTYEREGRLKLRDGPAPVSINTRL